jgi:hypothetical protein
VQRILFILLTFLMASAPGAASADCVSPAGVAGTMDYFGAPDNVFKFCNGTDWLPMGGDSGGGSSAGDYRIFTENGTWTKPAGLDDNRIVIVEMWGGGGGGSGVVYGGGGGGGAYNRLLLRAGALGSDVPVTVGTGGGLNVGGGASSFGTFGSAYGGQSGSYNPHNGGGGGGQASAGASWNGGGPVGGGLGGGTSVYGGGGGGGQCDIANCPNNGGDSVYGGGGGGGGTSISQAAANGGNSVWGGGGGAGYVKSGGISTYGGRGGNSGSAGTIPGGGGGCHGAGARGEVHVWVSP